MKNKMKTILILIMVLCFMNSSVLVYAADNDVYTYIYDYFENIQESPNVYEVLEVINYNDFSLDKSLKNPQGMFVRDNMIYICDSGNNRIVQIERNGDTFSLIRVIESFNGNTDPLTFSTPTDLYVKENGDMYICDQNNNRVVKIDKDLNYLMSFEKPTDTTYDQNLVYLPNKVVVDSIGRAFVQATNVNQGLLKYEPDGTFTGFVGATKAKYSPYEYIWKKFSTQAQQAQMTNFVPTEYDNIYMDEEGFIYTVTTHFDKEDLRADKAEPIRRLNSMGSDILIKNSFIMPVGDVYWDDAAGMDGPSKLSDITAMENDIYITCDRLRGRIFGYDSQGNFLFGFAGSGNMNGYFRNPTAIDHMGRDLIILDGSDCSLTIMRTTEYGEYIFDAINEYQIGNYDKSADLWRKVLQLNGNYYSAYVGVGRALLRQGDYKGAMKYFRTAWADEQYGKAFKLYRKVWVEEHILAIFIGFFVIIGLPLIFGKIKKIKGEVARYEYDRSQFK